MRRLTAAFRRLARATEVPRPRPPPPRRLDLYTGAHICKAARAVLLAPHPRCLAGAAPAKSIGCWARAYKAAAAVWRARRLRRCCVGSVAEARA